MANVRIWIYSRLLSCAVLGNMAARSSLSALFPFQSQLDFALEEATTQEEKENLVHEYLQKLDEKDLKIPDFEEG